ncbi:MAG: acetoacetate--CoA ligase [Solirubrobacteraceae bacterium]
MSAAREVLWAPSAQRVQHAAVERYRAWLEDTRNQQLPDYQTLHRWSVENVEAFWESIVEYFGVRFTTPPTTTLSSHEMPGARWFEGATLNYAEHLFRNRDPRALAIQHTSETRPPNSWTWGELQCETARIAAGLKALGVRPGDTVAAYMPNIPETVAALLACASIGAIWSSAAPEFGARAVIDRFSQIEPKVLLGIDGYRYGGRDFDRAATVEEIVVAIPSQPHLVRFGYLDQSGWPTDFPPASGSSPAKAQAGELECTPVPFEHPLWVLYSSGTTGLPKAIVHSQGGILLEQLKVSNLHLDAQTGDKVFWFTTTGWMMWNFLVGVLLTEASIVLYDGNPGHPDLGALWDLAEDTGMTCFGTSAAFIAACMKAHVVPRHKRDLSRLRALGSTGSPLAPEAFRWVYESVGEDLWLFSTSGGTDVCTAFVGGVPTLPVRAGELQARSLGAAVESWDEQGNAHTDQVGELVITQPMPSMPVGLWGDAGGERYRESYFATYPGVWRHGDWIELTGDGAAIIHGRSDATINRGGVRIGTAEIYRAVLALDQIRDALVVDLPRPGTDGWMELFVVLQTGTELDDALQSTIRSQLRRQCSPRHLPDAITPIAEVPRTLSGKALEVPVKRILTGMPVERAVSRESLANPGALAPFIERAAAEQ